MLEAIVEKKKKKIRKWKKKHGDIYLIGINDKENDVKQAFIYRTLGREEYKYLFLNFIQDMAQFQERVCEAATLYPKNYDFTQGYAGFPETLSNMILESSGFAEGQALQLLATYREQMYEYDFQVDCMIHEAFPEISIEEIQMWNNYKTMYYLSRAEFILSGIRRQNIVTIEDVLNDVAEQEQQMQENLSAQSQNTGFDHNFYAEPKQEIYPEFQAQFDAMNQQQSESKSKEESKQMSNSEAEILAMLGQNEATNGRQISNPAGWQGIGGSKMYPELAWFKAESDLKGEYD